MNAINHTHKLEIRFVHPVETNKIAQSLTLFLGCDTWYVVCQREHLMVIHLTSEGTDRYALTCDSTHPIDKAIYHGGKTHALSLMPLGDQPELTAMQQEQIRGFLTRSM